jgi:hypothetical protein
MLKFLSIGLCGVMLAMCAASAGAAVTTEIIIILDSSGSVQTSSNPPYANWYAELNFARDLVADQRWDGSSVAFGMINYSGAAGATYQEDIDAGRLVSVFDLLEYGIDGNDIVAVTNRVEALDQSDFLGGRSHLDHAFRMASNLFASSGRTGVNRYIVAFCDNGPYLTDYKPADDTGYVSDVLAGLRNDGVGISIISMTTTSETFEKFIVPVAESPQYAFNLGSYADDLDYETLGDLLLLSGIPEPATLSLLAVGGLAVLRRRLVKTTC